MSSKVSLPRTQSDHVAPTFDISLPARTAEKHLQVVRWFLPLALSSFVILIEFFEHTSVGAWLHDEATLVPELFLFGAGLPLIVFVALSWVSQQWRLRRQDAEALQYLYLEATEAREELAQLGAERRRLLRRQVKVHEQERRRIAGELHDVLGSLLTRLNANLGLFHDKISVSPQELQTYLEECQGLVTQTMDYAHGIYASLRPPVLDKLGLAAALRAETRQRLWPYNLQWQLHTEGDLDNLPDEVNMAAFRITQEALTNVIRHAQAQHVEISLVQEPDILHLTVCDDGIGFQPSADESGYRSLGLIGMSERAQAIGGKFQVDGTSQDGTSISVTLPFKDVDDG